MLLSHFEIIPTHHLALAELAFQNLHRSCIEAIFSFERFVFLMLSVECFQHQHQQQDLNTVQHFSPKDMIQALSVAEKFVWDRSDLFTFYTNSWFHYYYYFLASCNINL